MIDSWRRVLEESEPGSLTLNVGTIWLDASTTSPEAPEHIHILSYVLFTKLLPTTGGARFLNLIRIAENWRILGHALDEPTRNQLRAALVDHTREADPHSSPSERVGGA